jgi:hypothetical protein
MEGTAGVYSYPSVESIAASEKVSHQQDVAEAGNNPFRSIFREIAMWQEALEEKTAEANVAYDVRNQNIRKIFYELQKRLADQKKQLQQKQMDLMSILTSKDPLNQQWSLADAMRGNDPALLEPLHISTSRLPALFKNMFPTEKTVHAMFGTVKLDSPPVRDDAELIEMRYPVKHYSDPDRHKAMLEIMFAIRSALFYEAKCYTLMSQSEALNKQYSSCKDALNDRPHHGLPDEEDWEEQKHDGLQDGSGAMYVVNPAENPYLSGPQQAPGPPQNVLDELARMYMSNQKPTVVISMECVDLKIDYASLLADKERHLMQWIKFYRMARNLTLSLLINTITAEIDELIRSLYQNKHSTRLEFEVGSVQAHRDLLRELIDAQLREWQTDVNGLIKKASDHFLALTASKKELVESLWPDPSLPDYAAYLMDYKAPASRYGKFKSVILENECQLMTAENGQVDPSENQRLAARIVLQPNRTKDGKTLVDSVRGVCLDWDMGSGKSITIALAILRLMAKYINYLKLHPRPPNANKTTTFPLHVLLLVHQGSAITPLIKEINKTIRSIEPYKQWYLDNDDSRADKQYYMQYPKNISHYAVLKFKHDFTIMFHSIGRAYGLKDTPGIDMNNANDKTRYDFAYAASQIVPRPSLYAWALSATSLYKKAHDRLINNQNNAHAKLVQQIEDKLSDGFEAAIQNQRHTNSILQRQGLFRALESGYESAIRAAINECLQRNGREPQKFVLPFDEHLPHDGTFPLLVVKDEIHTALSTHSNTFHTESMTSLGWCNAVHIQPDLRVLLSSGTILPNPKYPIDVIKLLTMIQPTSRLSKLHHECRIPFWRPNLIKAKWHNDTDVKVADEKSVALKDLHDYIDELEQNHMEYTYNSNADFWKNTGKHIFQNDHTGLISYITMQYDKNKFPTIVDTCPTSSEFMGMNSKDSLPPQVKRLEGKRIFINVVGIESPPSAETKSSIPFARESTNVVMEIFAKDFQLMRTNEVPGSSFLSRMIPVYVPLNRGARINYLREYSKSVVAFPSKQAPSDMELAQSPDSSISVDRFNTLVPGAVKVGKEQKRVADEFATKVVTMRDIIKRLPNSKHFIGYPPKRGNGKFVEQFLSTKLTSEKDRIKIRYRKLAVKDLEDFLFNNGKEPVKSITGESIQFRSLDLTAKMSLFVHGFIQYAASTLQNDERFVVVTENLNRRKEDGSMLTVFARLLALRKALEYPDDDQSVRNASKDEEDLSRLFVVRGLPQNDGSENRVKVNPNTLFLRNGDTVILNDPADQTSFPNTQHAVLACSRQPSLMDDMTKEEIDQENTPASGKVHRRYLSPLFLYLVTNMSEAQSRGQNDLKNGTELILQSRMVKDRPTEWKFVLASDRRQLVFRNPKDVALPPPDYREDDPNEATHQFDMKLYGMSSQSAQTKLNNLWNSQDDSRLAIPAKFVLSETRLAFMKEDEHDEVKNDAMDDDYVQDGESEYKHDELAWYRVVSTSRQVLLEEGEIVIGLFPKAFVKELLQLEKPAKRSVSNVEEIEAARSDIVRSPEGDLSEQNVFGVALNGRNDSPKERDEQNQLYEKTFRKRMDAMTAQLDVQTLSTQSNESSFSATSSASASAASESVRQDRNTYNDLFAAFPSFGLDELRHLYLNFFTQSSPKEAHIFMGNYQDVLGLSVINTVYGHIAELPSNISVLAQTVFRIARFCGLPKLKDPRDWKIRFFVYVSTLGFDNGGLQVQKTSEEVLWDQYQMTQDLGANMLRSLAEKAFDCPLMQDYNSDPNNPIQCAVNVGQAEFQFHTRSVETEDEKKSESTCVFNIYQNAKPVWIAGIDLPAEVWMLITTLAKLTGDSAIKWKINKPETACRFAAKLYYGLIDHWLVHDEIGQQLYTFSRSAVVAHERPVNENDIRILIAYLSHNFDEFKKCVMTANVPLHSFVWQVVSTLHNGHYAGSGGQNQPLVATWMHQLLAAKQNYASALVDHEKSKKELATKIETIPGVNESTGEKWTYLNPTTHYKVKTKSAIFQQIAKANERPDEEEPRLRQPAA